AAEDAVLLVGAVHDVAGNGRAVFRAGLAVAEVLLLRLRAAVAAHGHPAGIHDRPALVGLVADHGGQHRQRDPVHRAYADVVHHQVEEHVDAGADFGHAVEGRG